MSGEGHAGYAAVSLHRLGQLMTSGTKQHQFPGGKADSHWMIQPAVMAGSVLDAVPNHSTHALTLLHPGVKAPGTPKRMPADQGQLGQFARGKALNVAVGISLEHSAAPGRGCSSCLQWPANPPASPFLPLNTSLIWTFVFGSPSNRVASGRVSPTCTGRSQDAFALYGIMMGPCCTQS